MSNCPIQLPPHPTGVSDDGYIATAGGAYIHPTPPDRLTVMPVFELAAPAGTFAQYADTRPMHATFGHKTRETDTTSHDTTSHDTTSHDTTSPDSGTGTSDITAGPDVIGTIDITMTDNRRLTIEYGRPNDNNPAVLMLDAARKTGAFIITTTDVWPQLNDNTHTPDWMVVPAPGT